MTAPTKPPTPENPARLYAYVATTRVWNCERLGYERIGSAASEYIRADFVAVQIAAAVAAERERVAVLLDQMALHTTHTVNCAGVVFACDVDALAADLRRTP